MQHGRRASWCRYRSPERPLRLSELGLPRGRRETDHGPHRRVYEGDGRRRTMPAEGKACPSASSRPPDGHRPVGRLTPACPAAALGGRPAGRVVVPPGQHPHRRPVTASEGRFLGLGVPRRDPLPAVKAWAESRALDPIAIELGRDRLQPPAPSPPGGRAAGHLRRSGSRARAPDSSRDPRPPLGRLRAGASVAGGHGVGRGSTGQAPRRPTPPPALSAADAAGPSRSPTPGPGPARSSPPGSASTRYRTPFDQPKPVPPSRRETLGQAEPPVTRPDSRATVIPRP
jgi:hypothetical protein